MEYDEKHDRVNTQKRERRKMRIFFTKDNAKNEIQAHNSQLYLKNRT